MRIVPVVAAALVLAALLASGPARAQKSGAVFPFPYETVTLENGLTAYLIKAGAPGQIAYLSIVRTGSRDEVEAGKSGFAHFFEHMMFRGTKKYPDYDRETTKMGAFRNGTTSDDRTLYYLVANTGYLEKIIDIESDRFQNLQYSEADFKTEAGAILGEKQQSAREPQRVLDEKVRETVFLRHPYGHTTIGYDADVRAMPQGYAYSQAFYRRFYRPENVVVVIAGDFDRVATAALLRKYYGGWARGYQAPAIPAEPPQSSPRRKTVPYPGRTLPVLSIHHRAPGWNPADRMGVALEVLGRVAFGDNSPLYRRLVLQERRVQALSQSFDLARDPSLVSIQTTVSRPDDLKGVEDAILAEIRAYQDAPIDAARLAATKQNLKYSFLMQLETAQSVAFAVVQPLVDTGRLDAIEDYFRTLDAVTPDDVREAARRFLVESGRTTVTMVQEG